MEKILERAAFDALSPQARMDFMRSGGNVKPGVQAGVGLGNYTKGDGYKKPGEVAEPQRKSAEAKLCALLTEFTAVNHQVVREIWWANNHATVSQLAKEETTRSTSWIGYFVTQINHMGRPVITEG